MAVNCKQALSAYKKSTSSPCQGEKNRVLKTLFFSAGGAAPRTSAGPSHIQAVWIVGPLDYQTVVQPTEGCVRQNLSHNYEKHDCECGCKTTYCRWCFWGRRRRRVDCPDCPYQTIMVWMNLSMIFTWLQHKYIVIPGDVHGVCACNMVVYPHVLTMSSMTTSWLSFRLLTRGDIILAYPRCKEAAWWI